MQYAERSPHPSLAGVVEKIWILSGDAAELAGQDQPVLPDGKPEIVLHFGDAFQRVDEGRVTRQASALIAGQLNRALTLRPTGRVEVLGVRLRPYGAAALGIGPAQALCDSTVEAHAISARLGRVLDSARDATGEAIGSLQAVQDGLSSIADERAVDSRVRFAADVIQRRQGCVSIGRLAEVVGWSRRTLERRFLETVGIGPKRLARIARFQHALAVLEDADVGAPGTHTAASCGYADHAHFIREFREFSGSAPGAHLVQRAELSGFFRGTPAND
jgi:AraC-like DNA-binding protein